MLTLAEAVVRAALRRRIKQHLNGVEQARQALHLVDEDSLKVAGPRRRLQTLFELARITGELEIGWLVREIDRDIGIERGDESRFAGLTRI